MVLLCCGGFEWWYLYVCLVLWVLVVVRMCLGCGIVYFVRKLKGFLS